MSDLSDKVSRAFRRYLASVDADGEAPEGLFEGLNEDEQSELISLIEVYDLAGAVDCATAPSPGFVSRVQSRLDAAQEELKQEQAGLFAAPENLAAKTTPPGFGAWLRQRRKALGMSLQELAGATGCSDAAVANLENGSTHPRSLRNAQLQRIAGALKIGWAEFVHIVQSATVGPQKPTQGFARRVGPHRDLGAELKGLIEEAREDEAKE